MKSEKLIIALIVLAVLFMSIAPAHATSRIATTTTGQAVLHSEPTSEQAYSDSDVNTAANQVNTYSDANSGQVFAFQFMPRGLFPDGIKGASDSQGAASGSMVGPVVPVNANASGSQGSSSSAGAEGSAATASVDPTTKATPLQAIGYAQKNTEQTLVKVTKPVADETVYKESYAICGVRNEGISAEDTLVVLLAKYNAQKLAYEEANDINGASALTIGASGVFIINVKLIEGDNKFALAAYRQSKAGDLTVADVQVIKFNVVYRGSDFADKISERLKEITVSTIIKVIESDD